MSETTLGWVLSIQSYDSSNRLYWEDIGWYRVKETAERLASERNTAILARLNRELLKEYDTRLRAIKEHNALVDTGLRSTKRPVPDPPLLKTDLTYEEGRATVAPIEWDD
jgi:hypothetical protein